MALLRNREVSIVGVTGGEDPQQMFTVQYSDGSKELVPLRDISLNEDEHKEFTKINGERLSDYVSKISNKDYQDIVDSQNPEKIKQKQERNPNVVLPSVSDVKAAP